MPEAVKCSIKSFLIILFLFRCTRFSAFGGREIILASKRCFGDCGNALQNKACHFSSNIKAVLSVLLVAVVALMLTLAANDSLHKIFHADAGNASHTCAVTLFTHGQVDSATVEVSASAPQASIEITAPLVISVFGPAIENLPAGRAPPVSVSPLA